MDEETKMIDRKKFFRRIEKTNDFVLLINQSIDQAKKLMKLMEQWKLIRLNTEMHH